MTTAPRSVADIKAKLLNPSLTSYYEVQIPVPPGAGFSQFLAANGLEGFLSSDKQDKLNLLCCETTLPGSNIGTIDITSDYHGTTQRYASRRIYDDRLDMTFYVDSENYLPIRYFESWIKYIVGESINEGPENPAGTRRPGSLAPNYFYRMNYPEYYVAKQGLKVMKFEKTHIRRLEYEFINAFPISISSMPVSYDSSSLLKCTVSFSYIRYVLYPATTQKDPTHADSTSGSGNSLPDPSSPFAQANLNNLQFGTTQIPGGDQIVSNLSGTGALASSSPGFNIGGVSSQAALSSGNSVR